MDDGSVGGDVSSLLYDLDTVRRVGPTIGLVLNDAKCEIITNDDNAVASIRAAMPNIRHIPSDDAIMLGAPVGNESSVDMVLSDKLAAFRLLASRWRHSMLKMLCSFWKIVSVHRSCYTCCVVQLVTRAPFYQNTTASFATLSNRAECRFNRWHLEAGDTTGVQRRARSTTCVWLSSTGLFIVSQRRIRADFAVASSSLTASVFNSWSCVHRGESWMATT